MSFRAFLAIALLGVVFLTPLRAGAHSMEGGTGAADSVSKADYGLGAVVDVRKPDSQGLVVLAITPGGAADRMGVQVGDRLRTLNSVRLDGTAPPASALSTGLNQGNGALRIEAMRDGKRMAFSGQAERISAGISNHSASCGYVTTSAGVVPRSKGIFGAEITQIDGRSTPLRTEPRQRVASGTRVLVVREFIDPNRLNDAQLLQIRKMKNLALARAYKTLVVEVEPGTSYRIGARLLKDRLDAKSIRDNAYWEPVVWQQVPERCP